MNKYDYGYEIAPGSTIDWAYQQIKPNSTVLELGPSNGNLVFHLYNEKQCTADIVEIDEDAGRQAAKFSRNSCLGTTEGNLELDQWFTKLQGNLYDYIIILDVLEHVRNPKEVLQHLKDLLKKDGCILLSIPNIAHNSIIIGLMANQFNYTSVGLLDDTHVHFYTYTSVKEMLNSIGLSTIKEEVKQVRVGSNEIPVYYDDLPRNVASFLKIRDLGIAYQFLFTIKQGNIQTSITPAYNPQLDSYYEIVAFDSTTCQVLARSSALLDNQLSLSVSIPDETRKLRIDPLNTNCILKQIQISARTKTGEEMELPIEAFTGNLIDDIYVFYDDDPQIYVEIPEAVCEILFSCQCVCFDDEGLSHLINIKNKYQQVQADVDELKNKARELNFELKNKMREMDLLDKMYREQSQQFDDVRQELLSVNEELNAIRTSFWGKIYYKIRQWRP